MNELIYGIFLLSYSLILCSFYYKFDSIYSKFDQKGKSKYFSYETRKKMLKIGIGCAFIGGILIIITSIFEFYGY